MVTLRSMLVGAGWLHAQLALAAFMGQHAAHHALGDCGCAACCSFAGGCGGGGPPSVAPGGAAGTARCGSAARAADAASASKRARLATSASNSEGSAAWSPACRGKGRVAAGGGSSTGGSSVGQRLRRVAGKQGRRTTVHLVYKATGLYVPPPWHAPGQGPPAVAALVRVDAQGQVAAGSLRSRSSCGQTGWR